MSAGACAACLRRTWLVAALAGRIEHERLGGRKTVQSLEIAWPSGTVDKLTHVPVNQTITAQEGSGIVPGHFPKVPQKP